ncbi:MAG: transposase [Candidatus Midichloriaceae bacterium]
MKNRGDLTIWFTQEGIEKWVEGGGRMRVRSRQREYYDIAIQTMYTLKQIFNLRLRQTEGFTRSILKIIKIKLPIPDYTTVSKRVRDLSINLFLQSLEAKLT